MIGSRRLLKLKYDSLGAIAVTWERLNESIDTMDEFSLRSYELPVAEFIKALQKMGEHVIDICELPPAMLLQLSVRGVSISFGGDDDVQGLVITAQRILKNSNAPMIINTPHFTRVSYSGIEGEKSVFSQRCADDLDALEQVAFDYVDGERLQPMLPGIEEPGAFVPGNLPSEVTV